MKYAKFFRLFGIILFIYILSRIDIPELMTAFKAISLEYFLIGILFIIIGFLIRVWRWRMLINSVGVETSFKNLLEMSAKGVFLGLITPGKLGDFWKAKYLASSTRVAGGKALYTAFMDRAIDLLVVMAVGLTGIVLIYLSFIRTQDWLVVTLGLLSVIILTYFLMRRNGLQRLFNVLIRFLIPNFLKEKAHAFLNDFYRGFKSLNLNLISKVLILGFLNYFFTGAVVCYFIALALGFSVPFWYLFLIVAMAWLAAILPVTVLGLGTREAVFIYFFSLLGIPASLAVALSLLTLICDLIIIGIPGALLFLGQKS